MTVKYKRGDVTIEAPTADELIKVIKATQEVTTEIVITQHDEDMNCPECGFDEFEEGSRPGFFKCTDPDCGHEFML